MLLVTSVPAYLLAHIELTYTWLLVLAFFVGFAGNLFSVGIAWNSHWFERNRQGFALGVFGAGNVGASATKFIGPAVIAGTVGGSYLGGIIPGGWRFVPFFYAVLLVGMAAITWFASPRHDHRPGAGRTVRQLLVPLKQMRVWRFSLYYVVTFGAYVALAAWLPKYYVDVYDQTLSHAALLTALFIFPASLLRPVGGWMSDKVGARRVMYLTFGVMLLATGILMMPYGYIVLNNPDGTSTEVLPWSVGVQLFTLLVFFIGCSMGIGKAAVYKHIPEYFPHDVGAVGGLVGSLGALGGFFLPLLFAYTTALTGMPQSTFFVLFVVTLWAALWMQWTIHRMLSSASPRLVNKFEHDHATDAVAADPTPAEPVAVGATTERTEG